MSTEPGAARLLQARLVTTRASSPALAMARIEKRGTNELLMDRELPFHSDMTDLLAAGGL
jgi:hypothetical protein